MSQPIFNPFSKYVDRLEKKTDRLLRKVAFLDKLETQTKILGLMQENLVVVNLWLEKEFKGYKYLKKGARRKMYANTEIIVRKFQEFSQNLQVDSNKVSALLQSFGVKLSGENFNKALHIVRIMAFLKPGQYYTYLEGASFGKLLKNIEKEKMIGDCNQIVTFYAFLYSLNFPISDLQIKILPEHVCLHFQGIDIEGTNGNFTKYEKFDYLMGICELISTNLLDVSDFRDKQIQLEKRVMLKGAELAFNISSLRELVEKNLQAAYHNLAIEAAEESDFDTAKFFLEKLQDADLKKGIFHNAVLYYCKQINFQKAKFYAEKLRESDIDGGNEMKKYALDQEGFYYFNQGNIHTALSLFKQNGNQQMVKACYAQEFNQLQKKVANLRTNAEAKNHKADYRKMVELARLMEDFELVDKLNRIVNPL